ncbi:MAG: EamA family transporter [Chitinophagaceae bacterium]|nr:EamA family transporter [Chitinophagaceae bacterium]
MKKAFLQLHGAIILAGFTGILGKLIELPEGYLVWYRMFLSVLILFIILQFSKSLKLPDRKGLLQMMGTGAIISMHWVGFYGSVKYSNVSVAVTCFSAVGFFTAFMEPAIDRRRIDFGEVALGFLAICGIYLIFNFYPEFKKGIIFGIISAWMASIFPILNKKLLNNYDAMTLNFYEMGAGTIALITILPVYHFFFPASYFIPTLSDIFWLLILAGICTVYAFDLGLQALKKINAFTVNLSFNLEPVYSVILAFIIFKENQFMGYKFYIGFGLIILAIALQMIRFVRKHKTGTL